LCLTDTLHLFKITPNKTTLSIIIEMGIILPRISLVTGAYLKKKKKSPSTCHFQIFDENQNPVDIHTSIMCINILQNIKAVGGVSQTNCRRS
jgi:hypothetical protein